MVDIIKPVNPLALDLQQIQNAIQAGPEGTMLLNMARDRGNQVAKTNELLTNRSKLTPFEYITKYGPEATRAVDQLDVSASALARLNAAAERDTSEHIHDDISSVLTGVNTALGGLGVLAATAVNPQAGLEASQLLGDYRNWADSTKSEGLQNSNTLAGMATTLDNIDNKAQYEVDKKNDGEVVASLKSFGRDAYSGVARLIENPDTLETGVAEGIGSVLASGPIAKSLSLLGSATTKALLGESVKAAAAGENVALSIGLQEGGGAYSQTAQDIMGMSHSDLMSSSSDYRELVMGGTDPETAKRQVAIKGATTAAAIQGPIGALTGKLVEGFEAHPLSVPSIGSALKNVLSETTEEGIQSLTGQVAQNTGTRFADENKNLIEGAGSATVTGAILGGLSAGVIQTPSLALTSAAKGISTGVNNILKNGENVTTANNVASPVSEENISAAINIATEQAPNVAESVRTLASETNIDPETIEPLVQRVTNATQITPEEIITLPSHLQDEVAGQTNRFVVLAQMARVAANSDSQDDRTSAANFVVEQLNNQNRLINEDIPSILENVPHDREEYIQIEQYSKILNAIQNVPAIQEAIEIAKSNKFSTENPVNDNTVNTPEGQQTVQNVINIANDNPQNANLEINNQVLDQADKGNITLSPEQRQIIQNSSSLIQAGKTFQQEMTANETAFNPEYISEDTDIVSANIADNDNGSSYKYSMETHIRRINDAIKRNDQKAAKERMIDLGLFARHMRNKAEAHIASFNANGESKTYQSLGASHKWLPEDKRKPVFTKPNNENSLKLARRIHAEANAVVQLNNNMAEMYPQYGVKPISVAPLAPKMLIPLVQKSEVNNRDLGDTNTSDQLPQTPQSTTEVKETSEAVVQSEVTDQGIKTTPEIVSEITPETTEPVQETLAQASIPEQETPVSEAPTETPVQVEEPESVISETNSEPQTISETYPDLIEPTSKDGTKKKNYFKEAFNFPKKMTSRMVKLTNPINELTDLLDRPNALVDFMGNDVDYDVTRENRVAYQNLLDLSKTARFEIKTRLKTHFGTNKDSSGKSLMDLFLEGKEVNRYMRGRMLNILERTPSGLRYNPQLIETAIIAGLHWVLNNDQSKIELDRSDIASLIGITEANVTSQDILDFNRGISVDIAARNLADQIIKFWGVKPNNNISDSYTKGIAEAVAKEVLYGLKEAKLLEFDVIGRSNKTFNRILTDNLPDNIQNIIDSIDGASNLLSDIALIEKERSSFTIGTPPTEVATKQLRSPMVDNTPQQKKSISVAQNTPFYVNMIVHDFISAIGEKSFMTLMGGVDYNEGDLNINHEKSVIGKNRTLISSFKSVLSQMKEVHAYAFKNNMEAEDVPIYYNFNVSKVGRLQMQGINNPQSDKTAREVFMPTKTTLDMTNENDQGRYWMTIGQGLGLKTEKLTRAEVVAQAKELTSNKYENVINQLIDWLNNPDVLSSSITDDMQGLSMHGIHSLLSVATYYNALSANKNISNFTHYNYLEADGKTNGPINALSLLTTGEFTPEWIKTVAKGGFFIGAQNKSLNSHIQNEDSKDLYQTIADLFSTKQSDLISDLANNNPKALTQFQSLLNVMNAIDANIDFNPDTNELKIGRGSTKNPLTISIYGSGQDGIASNITNELINIIYEKISDSDEILDTIQNDIENIINNKPGIDKDTGNIFINYTNNVRPKQTRQKFTFSNEEFNRFKANVRIFFVNKMSESITEGVLGNVSDATSAVQKSTQIQSIILTALFNNELIARLAKKKLNPTDDFKADDALSQNELNEIYSNLMTYGPVINTGTQSFFLSGSERSERFPTVEVNGVKVSMPESLSRSLSDDLKTPAYIYGPSQAGVAGVPSLVIGTGDGQMIQNILTNFSLTGLPVFDGFNMPASQIDKSGKLINEAVHQTWNENPLQKVADSFKEFLRNNPLETLLDKNNPFNTQMNYLIKEITKVSTGNPNPDELISPDLIQGYLEDMGQELDRLAKDITIRQKVLSRVNLSIDQMASAEAPYSQKGIDLEGKSPEEISVILNKLYDEEEASLNQEEEARTAIQSKQTSLIEAVNNNTIIDDSGVQIATIENMNQILENISKELSNIHKEMLKATLKNLTNSGYIAVFGTPDQLSNYQANTYPDRFDNKSFGSYGKIDPITKTIYISNIAPETLIHELIHAATLDKTRIYYDNPTSLSQVDRDAFTRLEGLMNEWSVLNLTNENDAIQDANRQASSTINGYLNTNRKAEALNEFMAWSLSNQNLIEVQSKTKVKNPLFKIAQKTYEYIKNIIWGTKFAITVGDSLFSNLRFNTRVIMSTPTKIEMLRSDINALALFQSPSFGSSDYITNLRDRFNKKIATYINNGTTIGNQGRKLQADDAIIEGSNLANEFVARGFHMDMQTISAFTMIQAALMTDMNINTASATRIQDIYSHVMNKLTVESFMVDPNSTNPADRYLAQEKFNVLNGVNLTIKDDTGRSSLMSSFLALSMVDESFRNILKTMDKPTSVKDTEGTLDAHLTNLGNASMDNLARTMAGEGKNDNALAALDALINNLIENVGDQRSFIEQQSSNGIDAIDNYIKSQINNLSEKVVDKSNDIINNNSNPIITGTARIVRLAASIINETQSTILVDGLVSKLNKLDGLNTVREFVTEIVGRTKSNASVFDMISKVRADVQRVRQEFREKLPEEIQKKFTRELTKNEWTDLFNGIGKTDITALYDQFGVDGSLELINDPTKLSAAIQTLETSLQTAQPLRWVALQNKAKQLATYMNTGAQGPNLLRNAYAVAHLFGDRKLASNNNSQNGIVENLDKLISLYALEGISQNTKNNINTLMKTESEGIKFAMHILKGRRTDEMSKVNSDISKVNHFKGHIPSENQLGVSLIVANDSEYARLISMGYTRLRDYDGSSADLTVGTKSYYFTPVSGRATYNQGVLQTVHQSVSGIDPRTGYSTELTAGRIEDPQRVRDISKRTHLARQTNENLMPVYNDLGEVIAFERGIDPNQLSRLNRNTHLAQMIGAWTGRLAEEELAKQFNYALIDNLNTIWNKASRVDKKEFINLATSTDPVHIDAWNLIPIDIKDYIKSTFGNDGLRIRRDMINDAVGFRSASIGDLWTGNTRLKPAVQKSIQKAAISIFGNKAYSHLVNSEKFAQNLVSNAKVLIVVKSIVVPAANLVSNMYQLLNRGVPARHVISGLGSKTIEINDFIKRRDREIILGANLLAAKGSKNTVQIRKIETELQSIKDSYKRMSIYPLIEAGEFSAISDGGITQEDLALANGKWSNWAEMIADKVPDVLKTPYRYAMITRDTALFQGLTRSVQYGDFLGKSILYDDLINRKKLSHQEAIAKISEEFVNFNRLAGRNRNYAESIGLLWFWNFKLRIMKVAVSMIRDNPFRTLMMVNFAPNLPIIGSIGNPTQDNFFSILNDGKLGWSMGPGMGLNAPQLNPWLQLIR